MERETAFRRTRVKICGITRREDALTAIALGADAIGLVFYPPSPRAVTAQDAAAIVQGLPPFVTVTGLFVDAERAAIETILRTVSLDLLQFHGDETVAECEAWGLPYMKAIRMRDRVDLEGENRRFAGAAALLLDAYRKGLPGGTGECFDWERIPPTLASRIVLAGGLAAENIEQAVRTVRPYGVDVSGGVEASRRIKSAEKIEAFMRGVQRADYRED